MNADRLGWFRLALRNKPCGCSLAGICGAVGIERSRLEGIALSMP